MSDRRFIAYYRVSTTQQGRSGLGLDAQRAAVMGYLAGADSALVAEFTEVESGHRHDRPELTKALAACKRHKATLVIAKLDRLSRNVAFVAGLMEAGVEFVATDMPSANRFSIHILAAVAEHEAALISARTKAALAAAKARGRALGWAAARVPGSHAAATVRGVAAVQAAAQGRAGNVAPVIEAIQASGVTSLRAIADELNERGIPAGRGGQWHPATVRRVIRRTA